MSDASVERPRLRPRLLLAFAVALQVTVFFSTQGDVPVGDPLSYAENAQAISVDPAGFFHEPPNHPFVMRVGITLPLAAIYRGLGVSSWTTNLPCLLATLVILFLVYTVAPSIRAKCVGLAFASLSTSFVLYGCELNADLLCGTANAVSVMLLSRRARDGSSWWIAGAVVVWFLAFLIKETTLWFAPAWIYAAVVDVRALGWRRAILRFTPALLLGIALVIAYLVACAHVWGDPFARITGINAIAADHEWTSRGRSFVWWLHRLTIGPPIMYLTTFGATLVVAVAAAPRVTGANRIWVVATAAFLLMYWFGSASTSEYLPLPLSHRRMLVAGLPGVLVLGALAADAFTWSRPWIAVVALATILPFAGVLGYSLLRDRPETAMYRAIRADAAAPGNVVIVCPDFRCVTAIPFGFGFRVPARIQIVTVTDFIEAAPPSGARVRVVVKPRARANLYGGVAVVQPIEALGLPRIYWHRNWRLYDAGDGAQLHAVLRSLELPGVTSDRAARASGSCPSGCAVAPPRR